MNAEITVKKARESAEAARQMHGAIGEALPTLRALIGELRTDGQALRATNLESVTSKLAGSRTYAPLPTEQQFEELNDAAPKPNVDLHD